MKTKPSHIAYAKILSAALALCIGAACSQQKRPVGEVPTNLEVIWQSVINPDADLHGSQPAMSQNGKTEEMKAAASD